MPPRGPERIESISLRWAGVNLSSGIVGRRCAGFLAGIQVLGWQAVADIVYLSRYLMRDRCGMPDDSGKNPLCFVLMPFGIKTDALGRPTNFDAVYEVIISPAVVRAGLDPIRADEERIGGAIHKPMFERLMLCPYAVADITGANPNVFYELGIRHAMRPRATVVLFAQGAILPFDIAMLRCIPYRTDDNGEPINPGPTIEAVAAILRESRERPHDDSPVFQLVTGLPRNDAVDHSKTDIFRDNAEYSNTLKE